jgi:hypothetical protein
MKLAFYLSLGIFFLLPHLVKSQSGNEKKPMLGISAGLNASNQEVRLQGANQPSSMIARWRASFELEKPVTRRLSLLFSMGYAQHGSDDVALSGETELLDYIETSIQAIEYKPVGGSDFYLSLGAYFAYGINGERKTFSGMPIENELFSKDGYNRFDWGLLGNIGVKFSSGTFIQTGLKGALNNCFQSDELRYYNFAVMATVGQTFGWKANKKIRR